jgi:hypothetical protein
MLSVTTKRKGFKDVLLGLPIVPTFCYVLTTTFRKFVLFPSLVTGRSHALHRALTQWVFLHILPTWRIKVFKRFARQTYKTLDMNRWGQNKWFSLTCSYIGSLNIPSHLLCYGSVRLCFSLSCKQWREWKLCNVHSTIHIFVPCFSHDSFPTRVLPNLIVSFLTLLNLRVVT